MTAVESLRKVRLSDVTRATCVVMQVPRAAMTSEQRHKAWAEARQVAMYVAHEITGASLPRIGRVLGNRDHTTVLHGVRAMRQRLPHRPDLQRACEQVRSLACDVSAVLVTPVPDPAPEPVKPTPRLHRIVPRAAPPIDEIDALRRRGWSVRGIAKRLDMTEQDVARILGVYWGEHQ